MNDSVHLVVPDEFDDPARPSGGNYYDRRILDGLIDTGWRVEVRPLENEVDSITDGLAGIPGGSLALVDGIIASARPEVFVPAAKRLKIVVLLHMPIESQQEKQVLSAVDAVITTSHWTREKVISEYSLPAARVHVAHPGTEPAHLTSGSPAGNRFLCVARVVETKGHDVLIDALERIADQSWQCTLVGPLDREPAFVDGLRRRLSASPIAGRVTFTGALDGSALSDEYANADLVVLASRSETYGMVLCEALARGIPVVATRVGGVPEAVGTAADGAVPGLLVSPGDGAELAVELTRWLQDSQLRHRLRDAARSRRGSLPTWSDCSAQIAEVLAGVAE